MKKIFCFIYFFISIAVSSQQTISLNNGWEFRKLGDVNWLKAEVPGTIHTDLLTNDLIPDPFFRDNESKVQWIENENWEYRLIFDVPDELLKQKHLYIQFNGLDTYAKIYLNNQRIIQANNMFRQWIADIKELVQSKNNKLLVYFYPNTTLAKLSKQADDIEKPENERVYIRKAQYQFGWDWGPRLVTCGIWKDVRLTSSPFTPKKSAITNVELITKKDPTGESFYFTVNDKPAFIKGANWIPSESFLPRAKKLNHYEQLIKAAKEANINMLRVWGGGVYEDDEFYDLCDKYGIMVWQDFMFAGALYPADSLFLKNVEAEIRYQVKRLRHHPSIVLWCGNNEIEEAWFNWGWQKQFNYSAEDSLQLWSDYKKIFHELIPGILNELDPQRPYWPSSPSLGWGRDSAYKKGDVHYWGVWWGKETVEKYNEKVGRFVSEYGMQGMPDMKTIQQFSLSQDWDTSSAVMRTHQKHPFGWANIKYYIEQKFSTPKSFEDLVYVSQLMQADAIKTAIEAHRRNKPTTMGTIFWQWNDCWPVTSWSAIDYYGRKKALYYEVKRSFEPVIITAKKETDQYVADIISDDSNYVDLYFRTDIYDLSTGSQRNIRSSVRVNVSSNKSNKQALTLTAEEIQNSVVHLSLSDKKGRVLASQFLFSSPPKNLKLAKPYISFRIIDNYIQVTSDCFAYGVYLEVPEGVELDDNYFHIVPREKKNIKFTSTIPLDQLSKNIRIRSLFDTY